MRLIDEEVLLKYLGAQFRKEPITRQELAALGAEVVHPEWEAKVKESKFKDWPNYGRAARGHIAIQGDHSGDLALRNIRIREIR